MKGVEFRPSYWGRLAAALREQIPKASPEVARSMIDAAAELQRVCDEIVETGKQNEEELRQRLSEAAAQGGCQCEACKVRRSEQKQH